MSKTWDEMRKESEEERQLVEKIIQMLIEAKISGKRSVKILSFAQHQIEDAALMREVNQTAHSEDYVQDNLPELR